ncbi:unnamed protein product, partial [Urochloa humidicola]
PSDLQNLDAQGGTTHAIGWRGRSLELRQPIAGMGRPVPGVEIAAVVTAPPSPLRAAPARPFIHSDPAAPSPWLAPPALPRLHPRPAPHPAIHPPLATDPFELGYDQGYEEQDSQQQQGFDPQLPLFEEASQVDHSRSNARAIT